jgi:DNA-directed RNA polymerase subunit RPC12/RpoP
MEISVWLAMGVLGLIILICKNSNSEATFTVTCDRCGSTNVYTTQTGLRCRNCGSEMKF